MDSLNYTKLEEVTKAMKEIVECAVCLHILQPETVVCVCGHHICKGCQRDQNVCPTCRKEFSTDVLESTFVRQILNVVPHMCRYKPCKVLLEVGDDHEDYCDFRPTICKIPSCAWEGPRRELFEHVMYDTKHQSVSVLGGSYFKSDTQFDIDESFFGASLKLERGALKWIDLRYDPANNTTFTFDLVQTFPDKTPFMGKIHFESGLNELKSSFEIRIKFNDPNRIVVSSAMLRLFVNTEDFRLDFS